MTSRPLTPGEIALARLVFKDSIDYARVRVNDRHFPLIQRKGWAMAPFGNLYMYDSYKPDYAAAPPFARAHFIHEMAHVWQYQNRVLHPVLENAKLQLKHKFNYRAAYPFTLAAGKDLLDYGLEQQASIIQEYYLVRHAGMPAHARRCLNKGTAAERLALYENVLAKFLKNPAYARRKRFPNPLRQP